jgi:hypothetical protein
VPIGSAAWLDSHSGDNVPDHAGQVSFVALEALDHGVEAICLQRGEQLCGLSLDMLGIAEGIALL